MEVQHRPGEGAGKSMSIPFSSSGLLCLFRGIEIGKING